MGSEFAFEDLGSQEVEKFSYKFVGEEACGESFECYVIERLPQYESSGYTRQIAWIDKEHYRSIKIEYYDRKNSLLKTLDFIGYNEYAEKYWRADRYEMMNHQTGKSTSLLWTNYDFERDLKDSDFNQKALKRLL